MDSVSTNTTPISMNPLFNERIKELLGKAKTGNQGAFSELYNLYFEKIYKFVYYRVNHKEIAEDLTEDVFVKAYQAISSVNQEKVFEGWLYQIARNTVIDHYRRKKVTVSIDELENLLEYESTITSELDLESQQKTFLTVLKELPPEQQVVIKLKFLEDLDNTTIAQMLHKSEGAIRVIQHRAINRLKELIENISKTS